MTDISSAIHPGVQKFMEQFPPAETIEKAKHYFSTTEILDKCNAIFMDELLSEERLFQFLTTKQYQLVDVGGGVMRWVI